MKLKELYTMQDADDCETSLKAEMLLVKLRENVGYNPNVYTNSVLISRKQFSAYENAIRKLFDGRTIEALKETYRFLYNYGEDDRELSIQEFSLLNTILFVYENTKYKRKYIL